MTIKDEIIEGAARAFWVDAYARHVEDGACPAFYECCDACSDSLGDDERRNACFHDCPFGTHARPGPHRNWVDFAPPTGPEAFEKAKELVRRVEVGRASWLDLGVWFAGSYPNDTYPGSQSFGHYLAMEAMGHGVSWEDDHEPHGLKVPHMEFYV